MAIPSFFKQTKPRGFNYTPRYYDPAKEEMEERRRAWGTEHRAHQEQSDAVPRKRKGSEHEAHGTEHTGSKAAQSLESGRAQSIGHGAQGSVYRSKIMRGDMSNYFHRRKEQVERHTLIRILVIIIVMVLAIYLYLRF